MKPIARTLLAAAALHAACALAQADALAPPASLALDGVPAIPARLARELAPYAQFRSHAMLAWHPLRREILVRLRATGQVYLVSEPGAPAVKLTDLPGVVEDASFQPTTGRYFVFTRAGDDGRARRLYRYDLEERAATPLSPEGERAGAMAWTRKGDRIAYVTQSRESGLTARTAIHVMDPLRPESDRVLVRLAGGEWTSLAFSEDGRHLVLVERLSARNSRLWVMDAATGTRRRVGGGKGPVSYGEARFSRDGKGLFATGDRGSPFRRLVYIALAGGRERVLTAGIRRDVDAFALSFDADRLAFITNEDGSHVLRLLDLHTLKELPRPSFVHEVIDALEWRRESDELAFTVTSARCAGDVFSYDVKTNQVTRWTNGNSPAVNTSRFAEPRIVRWKSFDGREIAGFLYEPPASFTGRRPVIVSLHDDPGQARPGFLGRDNYLVNELGIALIRPNLRGSRGFGKTFLGLDGGARRGDAVKDIGALLDWIHAQPGLDAGRVAIAGRGYGGYLALASAERYADRIVAVQSIAATPGPASHLAHPERITRPLFVAGDDAGGAQAQRIVASLKARSAPLWRLAARDGDPGFAKGPEADFLYCAGVEFMRAALRIPDAGPGAK